jgi:hypothetical protein
MTMMRRMALTTNVVNNDDGSNDEDYNVDDDNYDTNDYVLLLMTRMMTRTMTMMTMHNLD